MSELLIYVSKYSISCEYVETIIFNCLCNWQNMVVDVFNNSAVSPGSNFILVS